MRLWPAIPAFFAAVGCAAPPSKTKRFTSCAPVASHMHMLPRGTLKNPFLARRAAQPAMSNLQPSRQSSATSALDVLSNTGCHVGDFELDETSTAEVAEQWMLHAATCSSLTVP
jgi:hypothetical protein